MTISVTFLCRLCAGVCLSVWVCLCVCVCVCLRGKRERRGAKEKIESSTRFLLYTQPPFVNLLHVRVIWNCYDYAMGHIFRLWSGFYGRVKFCSAHFHPPLSRAAIAATPVAVRRGVPLRMSLIIRQFLDFIYNARRLPALVVCPPVLFSSPNYKSIRVTLAI